MMLLRTLVLERSDGDAPLNGALLCGFAVPQINSNFLVYSLDEETEPGSARVYVAALRKKLERYFLSSVDVQEDLHIAMQVFKQILTLAASGAKTLSVTDTQIPYHFVDLKGCKLPPARPEDHHSVIIKKALVMKVITLGASVPACAAIESASLIVPSIRFSSQMISPPKVASMPEREPPPLLEELDEPQALSCVAEEPLPVAPIVCAPPTPVAPVAHDDSLFEVDSTLTSLARVAQELTVKKTAVLKQEEALEQWQRQLQQQQAELDRDRQELTNRTLEKESTLRLRTQALESREAQLAEALTAQQREQHQIEERTAALEQRSAQAYTQELLVRQKSEKLNTAQAQISAGRHHLHAILLDLERTLGSPGSAVEPAQSGSDLFNVSM
ncbi:hypothetical protein [Pseudomonas sp. 18175]|uniref:hypothetical protein n=1 Tax=Pseudomonas sp. 18175 TaxID=3390056 RepID=UPI003D1E3EE8